MKKDLADETNIRHQNSSNTPFNFNEIKFALYTCLIFFVLLTLITRNIWDYTYCGWLECANGQEYGCGGKDYGIMDFLRAIPFISVMGILLIGYALKKMK